MPDFSRAEISDETADLTPYLTFLKKLTPGQTVTLPLEAGESSRRVMRAMNAAAARSSVRLARLPTQDGAVRFRVLAQEKRAVTMTEEAKRARVERARATRAQRQQERERLATMRIDPAAVRPEGGATPLEGAEPPEPPHPTQIEPWEEEADVAAAPSGRSPRRRARTAATAGG